MSIIGRSKGLGNWEGKGQHYNIKRRIERRKKLQIKSVKHNCKDDSCFEQDKTDSVLTLYKTQIKSDFKQRIVQKRMRNALL